MAVEDAERTASTLGRGTAWLTRFLVLRLLGVVYFFAFLAMVVQVEPLLGERGLLPAADYLDLVAGHFGSRGEAALRVPSVFWLSASDGALSALAWLGLALSAVVVLGRANAIVMAGLWTVYLSFVHVGQVWTGYGWEILLCETGFLAIFACPLLDSRPFPRRPQPAAVTWLLRWLVFRVMLGAGLIKLRGDPCWLELTCLDFHFETQPLPYPLSRVLHFLPHWVHAGGVLFNHVAELAAPFLVFGPRIARRVAGVVIIAFQLALVLSGNLSFLNWLTIVPAIACFDDELLARLLPRRLVARAEAAARRAEPSKHHVVASWALAALVAVLSVAPVLNLLSPRQAMNRSYDPFNLVNTYGAFGSVGQVRNEIVLEGTADAVPGPDASWREYEFPCKPGDPGRRPCVVAPFQWRLDWQVWFAAMSSPADEPWLVHLVWKLLDGDHGVDRLLAENPFPDAPPRWIRASLYRYRFAPLGSGRTWDRERLGEWMPPLSADDPRLVAFLAARGWGPAARRD